jgi:ubiquinone/menaquinone biosynthesis C-methylase UbiE
MVVRVSNRETFVGIDPSADMLAAARSDTGLPIAFLRGAAQALPFPDGSFDLVVTNTSFDDWPDQRAGLAELARVVRTTDKVVLADRCAARFRRGDRARTPKKVRALLVAAGLQPEGEEVVYCTRLGLPMVRAFIASL